MTQRRERGSLQFRHQLTESQRAILEFIELADGEGLTLADDIARQLGLSPRSMGGRLVGLEYRGLVGRKIARSWSTPFSDNLYGWYLTDEGREELS